MQEEPFNWVIGKAFNMLGYAFMEAVSPIVRAISSIFSPRKMSKSPQTRQWLAVKCRASRRHYHVQFRQRTISTKRAAHYHQRKTRVDIQSTFTNRQPGQLTVEIVEKMLDDLKRQEALQILDDWAVRDRERIHDEFVQSSEKDMSLARIGMLSGYIRIPWEGSEL